MTLAILMVLACVWAGVLVPPHLARRREVHPQSSVLSFRRQLAVLERTRGLPGTLGPVPTIPPLGHVSRSGMSHADARERRRDVLFTLAGGAVITLLMALIGGGAVWLLHLVVDALLLGYVALLLNKAQIAAERRAKVRPIAAADAAADRAAPPAAPAMEPALLRRSGS